MRKFARRRGRAGRDPDGRPLLRPVVKPPRSTHPAGSPLASSHVTATAYNPRSRARKS
ncbi:MAG TPA: hypothetical protein VK388_11430 [Pyrinomonadaceae bacterium]|nr:hypothetical protein [Pyrinomonadaceae bacterium]